MSFVTFYDWTFVEWTWPWGRWIPSARYQYHQSFFTNHEYIISSDAVFAQHECAHSTHSECARLHLFQNSFYFFNTDFTYFSPKFPVPKRLINRRMHYVVITWMWKRNFQGPKAHFVVQIIFHWARPKLYTHFDFWVRRVAIISPNWVPYGL